MMNTVPFIIGEGGWGAPLRKNDDDKSWTRASDSFNQFNWIFVEQEKIEIRTVMTDSEPQVVPLVDENRFSIQPKGIRLWNPSSGGTMTLKPLSKKVMPPTTSVLRPSTNGLVTVIFKLSKPSNVQAVLTNNSYQQLATVPYDGLPAGEHSKSLNVSKVPSGEYIILIKVDGRTIERFTLIR